jgi:4-hydroxy-3-methylbut-2-enyl diphosphate reductase
MQQVQKSVILAAPRGFCAGVDRAVMTVETALARFGAPVYVRHEIVHNKHVVARLAAMGAVFVSEVDEVPAGSRVIFSAHGVSPKVRAAADAQGLVAIDATCPLVAKVHKEVIRFASDDYDIVLIGHPGHEEVEGTAGEAPDHVQVVSSKSDIDQLKIRDPNKVVWVSQTTLSVDEARELVDYLRSRFPALSNPPSDDICFATQNRQDAVKKLAEVCEVVVVVGSANSSNSVRLVEVATEYGARQAYLVDDASGIDPNWFADAVNVGVTSGASVPDDLVTGVVDQLNYLGFTAKKTLQTAKETIHFALPRAVR